MSSLWARNRSGWTGGDGAASVSLPSGGSVWMFGDTFLRGVRRDGSRDPSRGAFVRNTFVLQRGRRLTTYAGGTRARPRSRIGVPGRPSHWYWPQSGLVENGKLKVLLVEYRRTGRTIFSTAPVGNALATLSLPHLRLLRLQRIVPGDRDFWGAALVQQDPWTYVYGVDHGRRRAVKLARAPAGNLGGSWEYLTRAGWSRSPRGAIRFLSGLSTQFSVLPVANGFALISQGFALSQGVYLYRSDTPIGPWSGPRRVYRTPEQLPRVFTYNALAHPELANRRGMLFSYNVNVPDIQALFAEASNFRPRFVRVPYGCIHG